MSFSEAVGKTSQIKDALCAGLGALGKDSEKIHFSQTRDINGSVDLDAATKQFYPNENRWDYVVGYREKAYFFEIHPASPGEVENVRKKYEWIQNWLKNQAPNLDRKKNDKGKAFYWIYTNKFSILRNTSEYRKAAGLGLIPQREFREKD